MAYQIRILALPLLLLCLLIVACKENKSADEQRIGRKAEIGKKYNAISDFDSLCSFGYEFQKLFVDEGRCINFFGTVDDLIKRDSFYILTVSQTGSSGRIYISRIRCTEEQALRLKGDFNRKSAGHTGCFVYRVSGISSESHFQAQAEHDEEENQTSYSYYGYDEVPPVLLLYGELIDYFSI